MCRRSSWAISTASGCRKHFPCTCLSCHASVAGMNTTDQVENQFDYSDEQDEVAPQDKMDVVRTLVAHMVEADKEVAELEEKLKLAQAKAREFRENLVPAAMLDCGLKHIQTEDGLDVEMREEVRGSLPSGDTPESMERRRAALDWLLANGHDGIIKNTIAVKLGRDESIFAQALVNKLEEMGANNHGQVSWTETIHPQTLAAFVREELAKGTDIPLKAFGVFVQRYARLKAQGNK